MPASAKRTAIDDSTVARYTLILILTEAELQKLNKLAARRNRTNSQCVRDWIAACLVHDSEWQHPASASKLK
jgi:hypothetical protein